MLAGVAYRTGTGGPGRSDEGRRGIRRGHVDPYALPVRPIRAAPGAAPVVDLRATLLAAPAGAGHRRRVGARRRLPAGRSPARPPTTATETIKPFDRRRGADQAQLTSVLAALDAGRPVAFYGWWPTERDGDHDGDPRRRRDGGATTRPQGRSTSSTGTPSSSSATAATTRSRAAATSSSAAAGARAAGATTATATCRSRTCGRTRRSCARSGRAGGGPDRGPGGDGPPGRDDRPAAGPPRLPAVPPRTAIDVEIDRQARCADPRASLTHLFFSEDLIELARARAICSLCAVREPCLRRALERQEPWGVWGGELVARRRRRRREARPRPAAEGAAPTPRGRRGHRRCRWSPSPSDRAIVALAVVGHRTVTGS